MTGQSLGQYRIEEQLGAGGMGVVYRAYDTRLQRTVALKLLPEPLPGEPEARPWLLREARAASALNHPNICTIYEVGEADGRAFIAMEYVEGRTLKALAASRGLPPDSAVRCGIQIADAVAHAHSRGVIHRDLEERQRCYHTRGAAQDPRLRLGRPASPAGSRGPDALASLCFRRTGRHARHTPVHGARIIQRPPGRCAQRRLGNGRNALRNGNRRAAVSRANRVRMERCGTPRAAEAASLGCGRRLSPSGSALPGEGSRRALRGRRPGSRRAGKRQALAMDSNLAETHAALAGLYSRTEFDWDRAIAESGRALELNPSLDWPHLYRAGAFYHQGLLDLAERDAEQALENNPENRAVPLRIRGIVALLGGRFADALRLLEEMGRMSEVPRAEWYLAQAYYYAGQRQESEKMLEGLIQSPSASGASRSQATLASFLAARGQRARAEKLMRSVTAAGYMDHHVAYSTGAAHAQLGRRKEALRWLRQAADTGFPCAPWFDRDPLLDPLRADGEFQLLVKDVRKASEAARLRYNRSRAH